MSNWHFIETRKDLPPAGEYYLVARAWSKSSSTVETAFLGLYKNKKRWVKETRGTDKSQRLTGKEYPFENVFAWCLIDVPTFFAVPTEVKNLPGNCQ